MFSLGLKAAVRSLDDRLHATRHQEPWLAHWRSGFDGEPTADSPAARLARCQAERGTIPLHKGEPDIRQVVAGLGRDIEQALGRGDDDRALRASHLLAATDVRSSEAFALYLDIVKRMNASALGSTREALAKHVVMHVSCAARQERAAQSCESFQQALGEDVAQLIAIGRPDSPTFHYDALARVLFVPVADDYEHLPCKIVAALFFLCLCGVVQSVLKVDDDHRLLSEERLSAGFASCVASRPALHGDLIEIGTMGVHNRTWHYGKCADASLNARPYGFPTPTRWVNGASGYFLNQGALRLMLWSHVYFWPYLNAGIYEDMAISDLVERQGGRLRPLAMGKILGAVDGY